MIASEIRKDEEGNEWLHMTDGRHTKIPICKDGKDDRKGWKKN